jgi:hypothetical protein
MKSRTWISMTAVYLSVTLAITVQTSAKITTFNVKGAGTGADQGTIALGINVRGSIVGYYVDSSGVDHGFLRAPNGTITTFDPKGSAGTTAYGLNKEGAITGTYTDSSGVAHGYLRASNGTFTTFDPKGSTETVPANINDSGVIAGYYTTLTRTSRVTASCALPTEPLPRLTLRGPRTPSPRFSLASTVSGRSRETTSTTRAA